jgi:hypothetical protein
MLAWLRESGGDFVEDNLSVAGHVGCKEGDVLLLRDSRSAALIYGDCIIWCFGPSSFELVILCLKDISLKKTLLDKLYCMQRCASCVKEVCAIDPVIVYFLPS